MVPLNRTIILTLVLLTTADITAAAYTIPKELLTFEMLTEQFPWIVKGDNDENTSTKDFLEEQSLWSQLKVHAEDAQENFSDDISVSAVKTLVQKLETNDPKFSTFKSYVDIFIGYIKPENYGDPMAKEFLEPPKLWYVMLDDIKPVELVKSFYEPLAIAFIVLFALALEIIVAILVMMFVCKRD